MASYNKVILMGNLTRDPQLRYLPSQTPVVEIGRGGLLHRLLRLRADRLDDQ